MCARTQEYPMPRSEPKSGPNSGPNSGKAYVIALSLITAACLFGDSMLYIVLPVHYRDAGLNSLWEVGIILSMNRLIRLPLNPLVGRLYRRISIRSGILLATLLAALSTLGYAFADSFLVWLVLRAIWGFSWTLLRIGGFFCILEVSDNSTRGYYMGLYNGLYRLGSLVGMLIGGLLADAMGFFFTAVLFGSCTALSMFAVLTLSGGKASSDLTQEDPPPRPRAWMHVEGIVLLVLVTGAVEALAYQGLYAATLTQMISLHLGDAILFGGLVLGAATLGGTLQALRWGWEPWVAPWFGKLSDLRFGRRNMMIASFLFAALVFGLSALPLPLVPWCVVLLGVELSGTSLTTLADAAASDVATRRARTTGSEQTGRDFMRQYSLIVDCGAALGPFAAYAVGGILGMNAAYLFMAALMLMFGLAWMRWSTGDFGKDSRA